MVLGVKSAGAEVIISAVHRSCDPPSPDFEPVGSRVAPYPARNESGVPKALHVLSDHPTSAYITFNVLEITFGI